MNMDDICEWNRMYLVNEYRETDPIGRDNPEMNIIPVLSAIAMKPNSGLLNCLVFR